LLRRQDFVKFLFRTPVFNRFFISATFALASAIFFCNAAFCSAFCALANSSSNAVSSFKSCFILYSLSTRLFPNDLRFSERPVLCRLKKTKILSKNKSEKLKMVKKYFFAWLTPISSN
jgi:hypothetical protein